MDPPERRREVEAARLPHICHQTEYGESAVRNLVLGILIGAIVMQCSRMDYQDAIDEEQRYCDMVQKGLWGDYNGNYAEVCSTKSHREVLSEEGSPYLQSFIPEESIPGHQVF
jgi:hypothetical protein